MSHHIYTTKGFVIASRPQGEASRYLFIFTRELGLVGAAAQGVRFEKSKLKPYVEQYCFSTFSLVRGREVWRVTSASGEPGFVEAFKERKDYFVLYVTILALLRRLLHGEEKHEALFDILETGFTFLSEQSFGAETLKLFEYLIVFRILDALGYIGKTKELEPFLDTMWSRETLEGLGLHKKRVVGEINQALKESQL